MNLKCLLILNYKYIILDIDLDVQNPHKRFYKCGLEQKLKFVQVSS